MSELYTCITCRVAFKEAEIQRQHYKSDWHRYNLKRKVAELVPVTAEEFKSRVLAQKAETEESNSDKTKYCESCKKNFNNEKSYENHLNSKKHKENLLLNISKPPKDEKEIENNVEDTNDESLSEEELDSDEWEADFENPVTNHVCLFCSHRNRSLIRSLRHMSTAHSFFIPDAEFCVDIQGLISYLGEKIYCGFLCLWCNDTGKSFHSAEAAQGHMKDKGHCKMLHEGAVLLEYSDFYDYTSSYPDKEENIADEVDDVSVIDDTDYQLVLPSGAIVGHRSLTRYYKQRFNPNSAIVSVPKTQRTLHKVLSEYKALGWTGTKKEQIIKKVRDIHYMHRMQNKWATGLNFRANKLQQHFRPQVNF